MATEKQAALAVHALTLEYGKKMGFDIEQRPRWLLEQLMRLENGEAMLEAVHQWIRGGNGWPPQTSDINTLYDAITAPVYQGFCPTCLTGKVFYRYGDGVAKECDSCLNPAKQAIEAAATPEPEKFDPSGILSGWRDLLAAKQNERNNEQAE